MLSRFRKTWTAIFRREKWEQDLSDELRCHVELRAADLRESGLPPGSAHRLARIQLGSQERYRDEVRAAFGIRTLDELAQDFRYAFRHWRQKPGFTLIAMLTLALGIGAATAVFSIVEAVLLRPLPYQDPGRLVAIWVTSKREGVKMFANGAAYLAIRGESQTLAGVTTATWAKQTDRLWTDSGPARQVMAIPVSASFFSVLGASPARGRTFLPEDEGRACTLVLSHAFWTARLGADPSAIGRVLTLDQKPCVIAGIMPPEFRFYPRQTEAWILLAPESKTDRDSAQVGIFARLKPGVTISGAQAEVQRIYRDSSPVREFTDLEPVVCDLHGEFTFLAGRTLQTTLLIALAAVLFVLLIACLNVANLMLARLAERQRELAVRAALGCGRYRLARQVLSESLLLASGGAVLGLGLTLATLRAFRALNPIELGVSGDVRLSWLVLAFSAVLTAATTLIFGLLPAFRASGAGEDLKLAGRGSVYSGQKLARVVIAVQVALSFVLLTGAGLLMSSAFRMGAEPLGFEPKGVLSRSLSLPQSRYPTPQELRLAQARLLARLESTPGLGPIAMASKIPPEVGGNQALEVDGRPALPDAVHNVGGDAVSPRYFELLRIPLVAGRPFDSRDTERSEPVALINQALARQYFPQQDPLGHRIRIPGGPMPWMTISGVVGNLKHTELMNEMQWVETPILYRPLAQEPRRPVRIVVREAGTQQAAALQEAISAFDPELPLDGLETVASRISAKLAYPRFRASVLSLFAISALLLSAVGLHGVLSQLVSRRRAEFGLRRAIGAQTGHLLTLVARQGGVPVLAGVTIGLSGALGFSRLLASLLYGTQPADPLVLAVVSFGLILVSGFAILWPARRAASIDPVIALKED